MDDLIRRQAAIDVFGDVNPLDHNANAYREKIKNLPSAQQWIPCSERWPEEYTVVLVSDGEKIGIAYRREYLWYHEEYLGIIVAWMLLPEPYEGEEE